MQNSQAENPREIVVLYVEDNAANLDLVTELLLRRGNTRLVSANNGLLALELARKEMPDVILMDIKLPGLSGMDALGQLKSDPDTAHIPVMALSSDAYARQIEKGLAAGFFQYITKPFTFFDFTTALDALLNLAERQRLDAMQQRVASVSVSLALLQK
jgi:CheY-like chemotaxis protein